MTQAYATLANHGKHTPYTLVEKVTQNGRDIALPERHTRRAVSREAADTTTSVLKGVVEKGTATAAQTSGRPAAGKTGTAEEDTAAWFAGYTPDLATVVAVMGQDPVTAGHKSLYGAMGLPRVNGGGAPAEIWGQYTRDALEGEPVSSFSLRLQPGADESQPPPPTPAADRPPPATSPPPPPTPPTTRTPTAAPPTTTAAAPATTARRARARTAPAAPPPAPHRRHRRQRRHGHRHGRRGHHRRRHHRRRRLQPRRTPRPRRTQRRPRRTPLGLAPKPSGLSDPRSPSDPPRPPAADR